MEEARAAQCQKYKLATQDPVIEIAFCTSGQVGALVQWPVAEACKKKIVTC
jgi:hypothetical protein